MADTSGSDVIAAAEAAKGFLESMVILGINQGTHGARTDVAINLVNNETRKPGTVVST